MVNPVHQLLVGLVVTYGFEVVNQFVGLFVGFVVVQSVGFVVVQTVGFDVGLGVGLMVGLEVGRGVTSLLTSKAI